MENAAANLNPAFSDQDFLQSWRRSPNPKKLEALLAAYGPLIYCSALRQSADPSQAAEITRAVFLTIASVARKLPKKTILADWLYQTTALAAKKLAGKSRLRALFCWFRFRRKRQWSIDQAILRLSKKQRHAVLGALLNPQEPTPKPALKRALRKLDRRGVSIALASPCPLPESLRAEIIASIPANLGKKPTHILTRRTLRSLRWRKRRRRFFIACASFHLLLALIIGVALGIDSKTGYSRFFSALILTQVRVHAWDVNEPARPWPAASNQPSLAASSIQTSRDLYQTTHIWPAHFHFTPDQWQALQFRRVEPLPNMWLTNGLVHLRNPAAPRSGFAGVLGFAFAWTHADFQFGGLDFQDAAVRIKGNVGSLVGDKHPFKVDLNKFAKKQTLAGLDELTFNSLFWDYSCLLDALGYEFFRDAGVPAPRTAFAWVTATVDHQWNQKPLGLYVMVEPVDAAFAADRFGSRHTPIFKPVTYELFKDLGPDWSAYADIYDLKTKATDSQKKRVIDFARLLTSANDADFAAQLSDFLDLDEFARFLAGNVLISNYDGILSTGQNFYLYLDPRSNQFGFIPWDLDAAWGDFSIGKHPELERASIWRPWVGQNRFLERVFSVEQFQILYRQRLEELLTRLLVKERLQNRIHELAALLREPIAAESSFRLDRFEQFTGAKPVQPIQGKIRQALTRPVYPIADFVKARARSVRQQLDGQTKGLIIKTPAEK